MPTRIEHLWSVLRGEGTGAQRRVDPAHPLDLYADFELPDRPGLVLFCRSRPPDPPSLTAIGIDRRQRSDGQWSLRICLEEPRLLTVFAELCRDIIDSTRSVIDPTQAGSAVLSRIERWRTLMLAKAPGLSRSELRGLIGELLVLEAQLMPLLGPDEAIAAWTGPLGAEQDFRFRSGAKIEVKAVDRNADRVRINGLGQLDGGSDPLRLAVVRLADTGPDAVDAITASRLIARLQATLADSPAALRNFDALLRFAGWDEAAEAELVAVRLVGIDLHEVEAGFPRLTAAIVPPGVTDASYEIVLPRVTLPHD